MTMERVDVAVIGAGIFGLSAAWALNKRGLRVAVWERDLVGSGSSGGLVGALAPHMPEKWNPKKAFQLEALLMAQAFWAEIETVSGVSSGYSRVGRALPLRQERLRNQAYVRAQEVPLLWQDKADWRVVDQLDNCASTSHGWVIETLSARLNPRQAMGALAQALRTKGVTIHEQSPVGALSDLKADKIVVAAGQHSDHFTPQWPKEFWSCVKGQSALLDVALPDETPMVFESGTYVVPHGILGTAVGSTVEYEWDDPHATDDLLTPALEKAAELVPALKGAAVKDKWAGIRPRARLPDPVIGAMPDHQNCWLLAGGFKIGMGLGPHMGETLARLMLGEVPDIPPSFSITHHLSRCEVSEASD